MRALLVALFAGMHRTVAYLLLPLIVVVVSAEVVARYLLRSPLPWSEDVVTTALLLTFMLAIPYCAAHGIHVRVETVYERFGPAFRRFTDRLSALCGVIFLGALAFGATREALGMHRRGDVSEFAGIPQWPLAALVAVVAGACSLYFVGLIARPAQAGEHAGSSAGPQYGSPSGPSSGPPA